MSERKSLAKPAATSACSFRPMRPEDRQTLLGFSERIWEGHDYLRHVFDKWVADPDGYFAAMEFDGEVVGCGRLMHMDERRGWLEGLRLNPDLHGRGYGKRMALHVMQTGRERGYEELLFSTYFGNAGSIRINEIAGFELLGTCTNLEFDLEKAAGVAAAAGPDGAARAAKNETTSAAAGETTSATAGVSVTPGLPETGDMIWNDWLFLPAEVPGREKHVPEPITIGRGACRMLLADNAKYPHMLDMGWMEQVGGEDGRACLAFAVDEARRRGRTLIHAMAPKHVGLEPFLQMGFIYFEQPQDVYLFRGNAASLKLDF